MSEIKPRRKPPIESVYAKLIDGIVTNLRRRREQGLDTPDTPAIDSYVEMRKRQARSSPPEKRK